MVHEPKPFESPASPAVPPSAEEQRRAEAQAALERAEALVQELTQPGVDSSGRLKSRRLLSQSHPKVCSKSWHMLRPGFDSSSGIGTEEKTVPDGAPLPPPRRLKPLDALRSRGLPTRRPTS